MDNVRDRIEGTDIKIDGGLVLGRHSTIRAERVVVGKNVRIGEHVHVTCDSLEVGDGSEIGDQTEILCPKVALSEGTAIGNGSRIQLNEYLIVGKHSGIGRRFSAAGQGIKCGEFLWLKNDVIVGGGGSNGPSSYLSIGSGTTIVDKCFINLSEEVSIGNNTALSYNVVILTHGAWQPLLMGFPARFAPVHIGSYVVVYVNSVILPGVRIGDYTAIGANAVVNRDLPEYCVAAGNPAKIVKDRTAFPRTIKREEIDQVIVEILVDYLKTVPPRNVRILEDRMAVDAYAIIEYAGKVQKISYLPLHRSYGGGKASDITLAYGKASPRVAGACHFDLLAERISGNLDAIGEDLRDYLRRRAIRIMTGRPFKSLPLANIHRLSAWRRARRS